MGEFGRSGADAPSGSRPTDGAASVSTADAASIPNAAEVRDEIVTMWLMLARQTKGIVVASEDWAGEEPDQTAMLIRWAKQAEECFERAAQAIEARQRHDREAGHGPQDESAVPERDAPNTSQDTPSPPEDM